MSVRNSLILLLFLVLQSLARAESPLLTILIWEEYISPDTLAQFERRHGARVAQINYTSEAEIEPLLTEHIDQIDLLVANTASLEDFRERGLLARLQRDELPNTRHIHNRWQTDDRYVVPYMWGTTGIGWRTDLTRRPASWAALFELAAANPGKVGLIADPDEYLLAAHFASGNERDFQSVEEVTAAAAFLTPQWDNFVLVGSDVTETNPLLSGELIATQTWNGDIAFLRDNHNDKLDFHTPEAGCMIWQDSFALSNRSENVELAHLFLNFINNRAVAAANAEWTGFASSNPISLLAASNEYLNDPIIRPSFEGLEHCQFYQPYPAAIREAIQAHAME